MKIKVCYNNSCCHRWIPKIQHGSYVHYRANCMFRVWKITWCSMWKMHDNWYSCGPQLPANGRSGLRRCAHILSSDWPTTCIELISHCSTSARCERCNKLLNLLFWPVFACILLCTFCALVAGLKCRLWLKYAKLCIIQIHFYIYFSPWLVVTVSWLMYLFLGLKFLTSYPIQLVEFLINFHAWSFLFCFDRWQQERLHPRNIICDLRPEDGSAWNSWDTEQDPHVYYKLLVTSDFWFHWSTTMFICSPGPYLFAYFSAHSIILP